VGAPSAVIAHDDIKTLMRWFVNNKMATEDEAKSVYDLLVDVLESQAAVARYIDKSESSVSRQRRGLDAMLKSDHKKLMNMYKQLKD
jgi:uncharacterized protein Yka (UPF0111/DUF47 family)